MPEWSAVRAAARLRREELAGPNAVGQLLPVDGVLLEAAASTGLLVCPVPAGDPLLGGAQAVLDREAACIWHRDDLTPAAARFSLAHELAHWWLHNENACCQTADVLDNPVAEPLPFAEDYVSGYSPAQRRETEANVFAAEFLLPSAAIRAAFRGTPPATHATIAARTGLSESAVLGQMAEALLISDFGLRIADCPDRPIPERATEPTTQRPNDPLTTHHSPLTTLDDSQRSAAEVESGPVLLSAGPGTGKTRTLVARVRVLLDRGTAPESILALTFSNKAAEEMRERVATEAPSQARRLWIGTFHAFGLELLRRFGTRIGLPPSPRLIDPVDAIDLLERNLGRLNLREYEYLANPAFPFRDILSAISRAKDELAGPEKYAAVAAAMAIPGGEDLMSRAVRRNALRAREVAEVFRVWQEILAEHGMLDFGDLLFRSVELLQTCPDVLEQVRGEYRHILVDEYQDINRASAVLVRLIAEEGQGLWAVGDLRQAIYRFRGASPANLTEFERDYPAGRRLSLDINYRSQPPLVGLFSKAAGRMSETGESAGWSANRDGAGTEIRFAIAEDEGAQADGIARSIRQFHADGILLSDQAILCRTNAQADAMAQALESRGVPGVFLGDLFRRREIKDMLSLLSFACEGRTGFVRVGQFPEYSSLDADADPEILRGQIASIAYGGDAYLFLARYLLGPARYLRELLEKDDVAARQNRLALYQLLQTARSHAARNESGEEQADIDPKRAFLNHIRRLVAIREDTRLRLPAGDQPDAVRLLTVHASKGLEFPVVYVPNLNKHQFPPRARRAMVEPPPGLLPERDAAQISEEQRLFFVALSRARDHLIMSRPRTIRGKPAIPSPLLYLVQDKLEETHTIREEWSSKSEPYLNAQTPGFPVREAASIPPPSHFPAQHLEQYWRCPRLYYYAHVLGLRDSIEETAYRAFHKCVWEAVKWSRERTHEAEGTADASLAVRFAELWRNEGPPAGHPHEPILCERARQIVKQLESSAAAPHAATLKANLPSGTVLVEAEHLQIDGAAAIAERWHSGKATEADRAAPRLALIREAVRQSNGVDTQIRLRYLASGEVLDAPETPELDPVRLQKYDNAIRRIRASDFPATPGDLCARCPFFFICPA